MPNQSKLEHEILWVIEDEVPSPEWYRDYTDVDTPLPNASIDILWMSDGEYADICGWLINQGYQVNLILAGPLLQQEMIGFTSELENWTAGSFDDEVTSLDLWRSSISEFNFSQLLWFDLVRLNVLTKVLRRSAYQACWIFARDEFVALSSQLCAQLEVRFRGIALSAPGRSAVFKGLYRWFLNLVSELVAFVVLPETASAEQNVEQWAYAQYPQNWTSDGKQIRNRFVGRWAANSDSVLSSKRYLISFLRGDQARLKSIAQVFAKLSEFQNSEANLEHDFVERYGNLKTIIKIYFGLGFGFRWLARWRDLLKTSALHWNGVSLNKYLWRMGVNAVFVDIPKNRYLGHCVEKALEAMGAETLLVPIFELVEGRSVVRGGKRAGVKVIGVQHGAIGLAHRWRVVLPQGLMKRYGGDAYQPDIYAVEGKVARDWLVEAGIEADRVKVVGAPRVTVDVPLVELEEQNRTLLVLGEYHRPQVLFDWCVKHILNAGYEVVLRPHPAHYQQAAVWLDEQREGVREQISMSVLGDSLADDLLRHKPVCVLASVTGAMVEVALSGWPVGVILSNWLPDYAPLTAMDGAEVFSSNNPGTVADWIERLMTDENYRAAYSQECQASARMHIAMTGDQAAAALADIF